MYSSVPPPEQLQNEEKDGCSIPSGVSESNWNKFQELKKRRDQLCGKSIEKRKKEMRKKVIKPGFSQPSSDKEDSILKEYKIKPSSSGMKTKRDEQETSDLGSHLNEEKWKELQHYIPHASNTNDSSLLVKNNNKEIDEAISKGNFNEAELLSDQLATRDFVTKVATAFQSKNFADKRKIEEQEKNEKRKKKKLNWGFEQKQRWESKGNM